MGTNKNMRALAFGDDLICASCIEKEFLKTQEYLRLLAAITKIKKVNSNSKCQECGKEYGCIENQEVAERLNKVLK